MRTREPARTARPAGSRVHRYGPGRALTAAMRSVVPGCVARKLVLLLLPPVDVISQFSVSAIIFLPG